MRQRTLVFISPSREHANENVFRRTQLIETGYMAPKVYRLNLKSSGDPSEKDFTKLFSSL